MTRAAEWKRGELRGRLDELLNAAEREGPQTVVDANGTFEVIFTAKKQSLEELFSEPGTISEDNPVE
ncbi:hypothetical protein DFI02_106207 [Rhizobium sp. PP-F2F-G20b]|nr:hypothetical protein DFI02_106207 [Rhizobium sp. PP-F2F-G20b]